MDDYKIRLGYTDSVNSVDKEKFLDVDLKNTSKLLHFTDVKKTIDQYEQFQLERDNCNRFRLILTINPFCSNVLFNPFTEMVRYYQNGGRWNCEHIFSNDQTLIGLDGDDTPKRIQMIANTMYSNDEDEHRYIYYPGYDMFDNHIMRNKSFKVVIPTNSSGSGDIFNTISDVVRVPGENGVKQVYVRVKGLESKPEKVDLHLYADQDILPFEDSVNSNLYEENGWFGFINHSNLLTNTSGNIEKVLNNKEACEFVDMYPSRDLFSFNPAYNKYFDRLEYNWDIVLTYPYENYYDNNIVSGNGQNGLKTLSLEFMNGTSNDKIVLIRSYVKHNLKRNDTIALYIGMQDCDPEDSDCYVLLDKIIKVKNIGDLKGNNEEYCFYIEESDILDSGIKTGPSFITVIQGIINYLLGVSSSDECAGGFDISDVSMLININLEYEEVSLNELHDIFYEAKRDRFGDVRARQIADCFVNIALEILVFRFARVVNGETSQYYIRKFKKLPNLKKRKRDIQESDLVDRISFEQYLNENAVYSFDNEFYKLGFATTIYTDECTQITYTDTIDVEHLTDNLGRPLSEIYATIIKKNVGTDIWYSSEVLNEEELSQVEQSCCFSKVTSGLEISDKPGDNQNILDLRGYEADIRLFKKDNVLYNGRSEDMDTVRALERKPNGEPMPIVSENDYFLGDVVEFSPTECMEYVLSDVNYRFNTYQRENPIRSGDGVGEMPFIYHEIASDDYDWFNPDEQPSSFILKKVETDPGHANIASQKRDEGYYHKAHYQIKLHDFSDVKQASHFDMHVREITPVQSNNIYLKIKTSLPHRLNKGDFVILCDDENGFRYRFSCSYINNSTTFYIIPVKDVTEDRNEWVCFKEKTGGFYNTPLTWLAVTQYLRDGKMCLRRENPEIPEYAIKVGKNTYLWRNILPIGDENSTTVPEYPYTNNAFYISKTIDFFLKRQDPDGSRGLYAGETFPNDVFGKIKKASQYEYKEESVPVC